MPSSILILYLKAPRASFVKTRLARSIGPKKALDVYKALVARQLREIPNSVNLRIDFTPADALTECTDWLGSSQNFRPQIEGDLGAKLSQSVNTAFQEGAQSCICIGGDCPALKSQQIESAKNALEEGADLVIGPCEDGGYYLIGLKTPQPELFSEIPWSTEDTLKVTLDRAARLQLRVHTLEALYDVDDLSTLERALSEGHLPE